MNDGIRNSNEQNRKRKFWQSLLLLLLLGAVGYLSRKYPQYLWLPIRKRTGDALWACCIFMLIAIVRPRWSTIKIATVTLLISYTIEFGQIYHRPWIDAIRNTLFGGWFWERHFSGWISWRIRWASCSSRRLTMRCNK